MFSFYLESNPRQRHTGRKRKQILTLYCSNSRVSLKHNKSDPPVLIQTVEVTPDHLSVAHAVAVPSLAPGVELKPAHDELPQPVPVIFIAGACNRVRHNTLRHNVTISLLGSGTGVW